MKITKNILANAMAATSFIYWILDYVLFLVLPGSFLSINQAFRYLVTNGQYNPSVADLAIFFIGGISLVISAWIFGYILGWSIEYFSSQAELKSNHVVPKQA